MNGKLTGICIVMFVMVFLISINLYQDYQIEQATIQEYNDLKRQQETRAAVFAKPLRPFEEVKNPQ